MKTLKRILAVTILFVVVAVIGYLVFTAHHLTAEEVTEVANEIEEIL